MPQALANHYAVREYKEFLYYSLLRNDAVKIKINFAFVL
jgi:hypothetical protein